MFQGHIDLDTAIPVEATAIPDVLFERGLYWASGRSGVVNLVAAHKWFNLAALKGRADAIAMRREVAETDVGSRDRRRAARSADLDDLALSRSSRADGRRAGVPMYTGSIRTEPQCPLSTSVLIGSSSA